MTKTERVLAALFVLLPLTTSAVYLINPSGTATRDVRGRIFGHIPYRIPSESMAPTLMPGDQIVTKTYAYATADPKRHEVIVFERPNERSLPFVSRIVAIEGDRVKLADKKLFVNGSPINEPYAIWHSAISDFSRNFAEVSVPSDHYFVLGDNRDNSLDSRFWGFLPRGNIIGRVHYIWFAEDSTRIGLVKHWAD